MEKIKNELVNKIQRKEARVAVVGLGHVGLPTAAVFADAGFTVIGVDVKEEVVAAISSGRNLIREPGLNKILNRVTKNGRIRAITNTLAAAREADVIIICVQTPLTKDRKQNRTYLEKTCKDVAKAPLKRKLVVVESTVAPGTMKDIADVLEEESGLKCGEGFWLAFCPERIAPGSAIRELMESNRVVSGYDSESARIAAELFKFVTKGKIVTTDCGSAEVAKLAENTFRYVNIAFANELALICEQLGVDVTEVTRLANSHSRVNIHTSGCGVGGPCLPKDPYLLLCSAEKRGFTSKVIKSSGEVNKHMPRHTTELVVKALKNVGKDMKNSRVTVLGVAYKAEVDDARNSPARDVVKELRRLGAQVVVYDPYCKEHFGVERAQDLTTAVKGADCLVLVTDHEAFKGLMLKEIKRLMNENPVIVDGRQVVNSAKAKREGFTYFRIGYGSN